jgi:hypothetical protein
MSSQNIYPPVLSLILNAILSLSLVMEIQSLIYHVITNALEGATGLGTRANIERLKDQDVNKNNSHCDFFQHT